MVIEEIKYGKKQAKVRIDGALYEGISLAVLFKYALKEGSEVPEDFLDGFLKENDAVTAKDYLFSLLSRGGKTEREARRRLKEKGFLKESIDGAVKLAKGYGYIDDEAYAKNYVEENVSVKGAYRIRRELAEKGVDEKIVERALSDSDADEAESAKAVCEKFMRGKTADEKTKVRLFRHLAARGFSYDSIRKVMEGYGVNFEEE